MRHVLTSGPNPVAAELDNWRRNPERGEPFESVTQYSSFWRSLMEQLLLQVICFYKVR